MDPLSPCLVFPLMRGGSFADRLNPAGAKLEYLRRLGLPSPLKPLTWRQKLRIVQQALDALIYMHTPDERKGRTWHRDFKPANILLDEHLTAFLGDTGFAKVSATI